MFRWLEILLALGMMSCGGKAVLDGEDSGGSTNDNNNNTTSAGGEMRRCETVHDSAQSDADFTDFYETLIARAFGNCASAACHGEELASAGLFISDTDAERTYINLITFEDDEGEPLVDADQPLDSWIHCFLNRDDQRPHGLGSEQHLIIEDWLHNGAPRP